VWPARFAGLFRHRHAAANADRGENQSLASSIAPAGTAEEVEGGRRISGQRPIASGCDYADWIMGACIMTKNGEPLPGPTGDMPLTRLGVAWATRSGHYLPASLWICSLPPPRSLPAACLRLCRSSSSRR
jgi:hypothetical protein